MPSETLVSLEEDDNLPRNTSDEIQGFKKKKKTQEINRIMNVLKNLKDPQ